MSKLKNARRRFRQGRITFKKLKDIAGKELTALTQEIKDIGAQMEKHAHIHGPDCHHDEVVIDDGMSLEELDASLEPHIHGEHCNH